MINWRLNDTDKQKVAQIAKRARDLFRGQAMDADLQSIKMDLAACHNHGCPLDFDKLLGFDNFNLMHDINGINRHLDHETGELDGRFLPRAAMPQTTKA